LDILVDTAGSLCVRGSGISGLLASAGLSPARPPRDPEDEAGSYEAPELRTRPGVVTAAADLYALGVILFQMLVGRQPRGAETPSQAGALGLPARLETLVLRLIDPNPDRRPESATEVVRELTAIAKGAEMAVLVVETEPPGARIVLDGQDRGRAPVRAEKLPPGAHSVRAEAKFYRVEERLIDCAAGSSSVLRLALQALECERCGTRWVDEGMLTIHRRRCKGPRA
jgi:serine/threonine protein kinase